MPKYQKRSRLLHQNPILLPHSTYLWLIFHIKREPKILRNFLDPSIAVLLLQKSYSMTIQEDRRVMDLFPSNPGKRLRLQLLHFKQRYLCLECHSLLIIYEIATFRHLSKLKIIQAFMGRPIRIAKSKQFVKVQDKESLQSHDTRSEEASVASS